MKISKKKTMYTRILTAMISTLMLVVIFAFGAVSVMAMAADNVPAIVTVSELPAADEKTVEVTPLDAPDEMIFNTNTYISEDEEPQFIMLAGDGNNANGASGSATADGAYKNVINFFITWLRRIGAMVGLIGAIMFGLSIKNNDAEQKQNGLLTMVAGFVVFAICLAADMFDLFS